MLRVIAYLISCASIALATENLDCPNLTTLKGNEIPIAHIRSRNSYSAKLNGAINDDDVLRWNYCSYVDNEKQAYAIMTLNGEDYVVADQPIETDDIWEIQNPNGLEKPIGVKLQ